MDKWGKTPLTAETIREFIEKSKSTKANRIMYLANPCEKRILEEHGLKENEDFMIYNIVPPEQSVEFKPVDLTKTLL